MDTNAQTYIDVIKKLSGAPLVIFEKARPGGLQRDIAFIADADGRPISLHHPLGFNSSHFELPRSTFDTLLAHGFLTEERPEDGQGRTIYRMSAPLRQWQTSRSSPS